RAPAGRLRWEVEARGRWLERYGGIGEVTDITTGRVAELVRERWEWSAMGRTVETTNVLVEKVSRRDDLSETEKAGFLGWLLLEAHGRPTKRARGTLAKYRRIAKDLGVTMMPEDSKAAVVGRLDFESGTEELLVA